MSGGILRVPASPEDLADMMDEPYEETGESGTIVTHCPGHPDRNPSLVISRGTKGRRKGKLLLHCRAGCSHAVIVGALAALGISIDAMSDRDARGALDAALVEDESAEDNNTGADNTDTDKENNTGEEITNGNDTGSPGKQTFGNESTDDGEEETENDTTKGTSPSSREQLRQAEHLWSMAIDIANTPAETYLKEHRHLPVPAAWHDAVRQQDVLRFSPGGALTTRNNSVQGPCMIARITMTNGQTTGYQVTPLDAQGQKTGRFIIGKVKPGLAAIRVSDRQAATNATSLPALVIAEGLETGLTRLVLEDRPLELWVMCGNLPQAVRAWAEQMARDRLHRAEGAYDHRKRWSQIELAVDRDKEPDSFVAARLINATTGLPVLRLLTPTEIPGKGADLNDLLSAQDWLGVLRAQDSAPLIEAGHALMAPATQEADLISELLRLTWRNAQGRTRITRNEVLYGWNATTKAWVVIEPEQLANELSAIALRSFEIADKGALWPWQRVNSNLVGRLVRRAIEQATELSVLQPGFQVYRLTHDHGAEPMNEWLVFTGNRMMNIRTREIMPAGQDIFALHAINADPEHMDVEPRLFEKVLRDAFATIEGFIEEDVTQQIRKLYEVIGHAISGGRLNLQKLVFLVGAPGTGKSVVERILEAIVGSGCANSAIRSLGDKHGMVSLVGASVIKLSDVRGSTGWRHAELGEIALSNLLKITGGDPILINPKFRPEFAAVLSQCVIAVSNEIPGFLIDGHGALGRRLEVIDFGLPDPERAMDPTLVDQIVRHELSGIVGRALDGLARLHERHAFSTSPGMVRRQLDTLTEVEPLRQFAAYLVRAPGEYLTRQELYEGYQRWLRAEGMHFQASQKTFTRQLRRSLLVVRGIRLPTEAVGRWIEGRPKRVWLDLYWHEDAPEHVIQDTSHIRPAIEDLDEAIKTKKTEDKPEKPKSGD